MNDQNDHDILIELKSDVKALRAEVKEINDNTKTTLTDHEARLRFMERWVWMAIGALGIAETIITFYIAIHYGR